MTKCGYEIIVLITVLIFLSTFIWYASSHMNWVYERAETLKPFCISKGYTNATAFMLGDELLCWSKWIENDTLYEKRRYVFIHEGRHVFKEKK